ncbi:hypothetical protein DJ66_1135 [Candidatus Liberibacter solanacearum]|uniref:Uncharacterized protein n=1 Tax=Candidatus Liberibacter solanacearum TaxID=556287 RepID=A0A0F4VM87_9HYPH|nr:hypothetical protein DJ66_1135 [Candidatus Liberibacter solanacearum]
MIFNFKNNNDLLITIIAPLSSHYEIIKSRKKQKNYQK